MKKIKKRVYNKHSAGITVIALLITILVVLITIDVTAIVLKKTGVLERLKEKILIAENSEEYIEGARTYAPIFLTTVTLPDSGAETRKNGIYKASSSEFKKEDELVATDYLSFEEGTGWRALREGIYYIIIDLSETTKFQENANSYVSVNGKPIIQPMPNIYPEQTVPNKTLHTMVYLNKGDILDYIFIQAKEITNSYASIKIYVMPE